MHNKKHGKSVTETLASVPSQRTSSKNVVINNKQILKHYGSGFAPSGQYQFPFSFQIPFWVPPSFLYSENGQMQFSIYYALEAFLIEEK